MPTPEQALQQQLRTFKGPALSVLAALFALGRPLGPVDLEEICCYGHQAIERALRTLAKHELVQRVGYHRGWLLTAQARQLSFFGGPLTPLDEIHQVRGPGGGLYTKNSPIHTTTTTTAPHLMNPQVQMFLTSAAQALISLGGVSPAKAEQAIDDALSKGIAPTEILRRISACSAYILWEAERGRHLRLPGAWAAGLIGAGYEPAGSFPQAVDNSAQPVDKYAGYEPYCEP